MIRVCNATSALRKQEHNMKIHIAAKQYLQISLSRISERRQLRNIKRYRGNIMNAGKMSASKEIITHYQNALLCPFLKQIETL
jgi:hypothetical protein